MPYDAVPELEAGVLEDGVVVDVEGVDLATLNVVADLPAQTAVVRKDSDALGNDFSVVVQIRCQGCSNFVSLPKVVGWRGDDKADRRIGNLGEQVACVPVEEDDLGCGGKVRADLGRSGHGRQQVVYHVPLPGILARPLYPSHSPAGVRSCGRL